MEKLQLVNFIAKVMEESGFKVYKEFKTSQKIVDIYGVLPSLMGDFGVVVACKNYDKEWEVGIDILKEMEMIGRNLKASKVVIVTSSNFSSQAINYASRKNIKLIDRDKLMILAKKFSKKRDNLNNPTNSTNSTNSYNDPYNANDDYSDSSSSIVNNENHSNLSNSYNSSSDYSESSNDYGKSHYEDIYSDDTTYISGKRRGGLGKLGSGSKRRSPQRVSSNSKLANKPKKQGPPIGEKLKPILNTVIVLIMLVVLISYLISNLSELVLGVSKGISGLIKILSSLILSYGLVLALNREGTTVLLKGTIVFFVSLIILIMMIIFA